MHEHYTEKERQIIREHWEEGHEKVISLIRSECKRQRNKDGLFQQAKKLGVFKSSRPRWTDEELQIIRTQSHRGGKWMVNVIKQRTGMTRTEGSIWLRLYREKRKRLQTSQ